MRDDPLFRQFLRQFVENDLSPDLDHHQVLAVAAAALVTVPLFVTVFMSVKYLMHPLQAAGWTEVTMVGDQVTFCAVSMLVSGIIAALEWDALALSPRDVAILGVLPIPRSQIVRTKAFALAAFAGAFVVALNALPSLLHPLLMTAALPMSPFALIPLIAAQSMATMLAGAFGFSCVVALREGLYLLVGQAVFRRVTNGTRSVVLFSLLVGLALVPARVSGTAEWMFDRASTPAALVPVSWFAGVQAAIGGRVLDSLPRRDLPARMAADEQRFTAEYRSSRDRFPRLALRGFIGLALAASVAMVAHLRNARHQSLLANTSDRRTILDRIRPTRAVASLFRGTQARRAGFTFCIRTVLRSARHMALAIVSAAIAAALVLVSAPAASAPVRTLTVVLQPLLLCFIVGGFRAITRTSADPRAAWIFAVTDIGSVPEYRSGVRAAGVAAVAVVVAAMFPIHVSAWGTPIALMHALNGLAFGWLLVEASLADIPRPLVDSIPPADALNTVGVVLLGGLVMLVFVASKIESVALLDRLSAGLFLTALIVSAATVHIRGGRNLVTDT